MILLLLITSLQTTTLPLVFKISASLAAMILEHHLHFANLIMSVHVIFSWHDRVWVEFSNQVKKLEEGTNTVLCDPDEGHLAAPRLPWG